MVPLDRRSSLLGCIIPIVCCLYNILVDGNRDFFRRGKYKRICYGSKMYCDGHDYSTCDHVLPFIIRIQCPVWYLQYLQCLMLRITYTVHTLYKKWMLAYYRKSGGIYQGIDRDFFREGYYPDGAAQDQHALGLWTRLQQQLWMLLSLVMIRMAYL